MQKDTQNQNRIIGTITAVLTLLLGIAFIIACLFIYSRGERPFSREIIGQTLLFLSPLFIVWGIFVLIGLFYSPAARKIPAFRDEADELLRIRRKLQLLPPEFQALAAKEKRFRIVLRLCTAIILCALTVYPVCYFFTGSNFTIANLNADVIRCVIVVLGVCIPGFAAAFGCKALLSRSIHREIDVYKQAIAADPTLVTKAGETKPCPHCSMLVSVSRCTVFCLAVILIALGVMNEGFVDVIGKAIKICTECIGLG